jgi:hypothetical protein
MCTYITCEPRFYNEINILYSATIQKMMKLMNSLITSYSNMTATQLKTQLNQTTSFYNMDLVLYTEFIIRNCLTSLLTTYDNNYQNYEDSVNLSQLIFLAFGNATTGIAIILLIIFAVSVYRNQNYLSRIADIFLA